MSQNKRSRETVCIQGGWQPKSGEPRVLPIYQSTTFKYDDSDKMGRLFDLEVASHRFVTAPKARRGERVDASADLSAACPRLAAWPRC